MNALLVEWTLVGLLAFVAVMTLGLNATRFAGYFAYIKTKATKYALRTSITLNITVVAFVFMAYGVQASGHLRGDIEIVGWSIGGGTTKQVESGRIVTAYAAQVDSRTVTPPPAATEISSDVSESSTVDHARSEAAKASKTDTTPLPGRKPTVR